MIDLRACLLAALGLLLLGCPERPAAAGDDDDATVAADDDDATGEPCDPEGAYRCFGPEYQVCEADGWALQDRCEPPTDLCDPVLGCHACAPEATLCVDGDVHTCDDDGLATTLSVACPDGTECFNGGCYDPCSLAELQQSYRGCEFLAVTTLNSSLDAAFSDDFAVVVGVPPDSDPASVTVTRDGLLVASQEIPAGQTAAISLPMVDALRVAGGGLFSNAQTAVEPGGAYVVTSSVPVVAYQFNPLRFSTGPITFSQTNDASLLLPTHALTGNYRALTWNTWPYTPFVSYRGFVAVAATADGTEVTVTSSTTTAEGAVGPLTPGQSEVVTLDRGDVLQLLSGPDEAHDLSGTQIAASAPVATFVGVDCRFMPDDQPACDHLEEMAFPVETWGPLVVVSATEHPSGGIPLTARHRVMARTSGTTVTFDPAVAPDATLDAGEWVEFDSDQDFVVQGTGPIAVASVMWGQEASRATTGGDPALATGIPTSQWRSEYDFLVPDTYTSNGLNVVREAGAPVRLDGVALDGFVAIGASGYERRRVSVSEGSHRIEGDGRFSITAYGYAQYTSYWYPAGLDLLR